MYVEGKAHNTHGEGPGPGFVGHTLQQRGVAAAATLLDIDALRVQYGGEVVRIGKRHRLPLGAALDSFVLHQLLYLIPPFFVIPGA